MNKYVKLFLLVFVFFSCDSTDDENKIEQIEGKLTFGFKSNTGESVTFKSTQNKFTRISATIKDSRDFEKNYTLNLSSFGVDYITEPISLLLGDYKLVQYVVYSGENVVYASPVKGSKYAHFVSSPLELDFNISRDSVTNITPEVISVEGRRASDFGYVSLIFDEVEVIDFMITAFLYDTTTQKQSITDASLIVKSGDIVLFNDSISNVTNTVSVPAKYEEYTLTVSKNELSKTKTISKEVLASSSSDPLEFVLGSYIPTDGLVAYYPFNGNANDESGNNFHGTLYGAPYLTEGVRGKANSAYGFDGVDDYIETKKGLNVGLGDYTFSLWMKGQEQTNSAAFIINKISDSDRTKATGLYVEYPSVTLGWAYVKSNGSYGDVDIANTSNILDGTWKHLVYIRKDGVIHIYIQGELKSDSYTLNTDLYNEDHPLFIASTRIQQRGTREFKGIIDNVRVYDRALSKDEIEALYNE
jgi:hypothetical protein